MINRTNLAILANYLQVISPTLTEDEFGMTDYCYTKLHGGTGDFAQKHECGTICCAIGWSPNIGGGFAPQEREQWASYVERVYGLCAYMMEDQFQFMFSDNWAIRDNTPMGCVRRIRYYLAYGVPEDFDALDIETYKPIKEEVSNKDVEDVCLLKTA